MTTGVRPTSSACRTVLLRKPRANFRFRFACRVPWVSGVCDFASEFDRAAVVRAHYPLWVGRPDVCRASSTTSGRHCGDNRATHGHTTGRQAPGLRTEFDVRTRCGSARIGDTRQPLIERTDHRRSSLCRSRLVRTSSDPATRKPVRHEAAGRRRTTGAQCRPHERPPAPGGVMTGTAPGLLAATAERRRRWSSR